MTMELIEILRADGLTIEADGDFIEIKPAHKVTEELMNRLRKHKPEILAELKREERSAKVLSMLADQPGIQRTFLTDSEADPQHVIVTIAIRDQYTFEMTIPREKYDAFLIVELIEKAQIQ